MKTLLLMLTAAAVLSLSPLAQARDLRAPPSNDTNARVSVYHAVDQSFSPEATQWWVIEQIIEAILEHIGGGRR